MHVAESLLDYHSLIEYAKKEKILKESLRKSKKPKKDDTSKPKQETIKATESHEANYGLYLKPNLHLQSIIESIKSEENEEQGPDSPSDSSESENNLKPEEEIEVKNSILTAVNEFNKILKGEKKQIKVIDSKVVHEENKQHASKIDSIDAAKAIIKQSKRMSKLSRQINKLSKINSASLNLTKNSLKDKNSEQKEKKPKIPLTESKVTIQMELEADKVYSTNKAISLHTLIKTNHPHKHYIDGKKIFNALRSTATKTHNFAIKISNTQRSLSTSEGIREFCDFKGKCIMKKAVTNNTNEKWPTRPIIQTSHQIMRSAYYSGRNASLFSNKNLYSVRKDADNETPASLNSVKNHENISSQRTLIPHLRSTLYKRRIVDDKYSRSSEEIVSNNTSSNQLNPLQMEKNKMEMLKKMQAFAKFMQYNIANNVNEKHKLSKRQASLQNCAKYKLSELQYNIAKNRIYK